MAIRLGGGDAPDDTGEIMAEINITPLTDIFLVLLIIFMVTSSVISNTGVDVKLPQASAQTASTQPEGVVITLMSGGVMAVNGVRIPAQDFSALGRAVQAAFTRTTSRLVILEGDREAYLGSAISVMDVAKSAGAQKFAIATETKK